MGLGRAFRALVRRDRLFDGALHEPLGIPDTRLLYDDAWLLLWWQHYWESWFLVEFLGHTFWSERMHRLYRGSVLLWHAFWAPKGTLILTTYNNLAWLVRADSPALHLVLHFDQLLQRGQLLGIRGGAAFHTISPFGLLVGLAAWVTLFLIKPPLRHRWGDIDALLHSVS